MTKRSKSESGEKLGKVRNVLQAQWQARRDLRPKGLATLVGIFLTLYLLVGRMSVLCSISRLASTRPRQVCSGAKY